MKKNQSKKTAKKSPATAAIPTTPKIVAGAHGNAEEPPATPGNETADDQEFLHFLDRILDATMWSDLSEVELARCFFSAGYTMLDCVVACEGCTQGILDEAKEFVMDRREELAEKELSTKKN